MLKFSKVFFGIKVNMSLFVGCNEKGSEKSYIVELISVRR